MMAGGHRGGREKKTTGGGKTRKYLLWGVDERGVLEDEEKKWR